MGILDEAIREHLELKRQHGAGDSELKQLEDEAFGQAERPGAEEAAPDPFAEAPTEFMAVPEAAEETSARGEPPTIADLQEPPPPAEEAAPVDEAPAEEEQPAMEHEVVTDVPAPAEQEAEAEPGGEIEAAGPSTEERHAIAEQPTELHDMEAELDSPPSPTDEELVEEEITEPRLAPADPLAGLEEDEEAEVSVTGPAPDDDDEYEDEDDTFWNEQRLSDELDQALEAPRDPEPELADEVELDDEVEVELDEEPEPVADPEAVAPRHDEDVLEETPDFLEETPEDDQLWFEQKPPKDFDFDD
jgi:hypothetical protein